jgi:hypothetical protein
MRGRALICLVGTLLILLGLSAGTAVAAPGLLRGVAVDAETGTSVRGVTVKALDPVQLDLVAGVDITNGSGRFQIPRLTGDEYAFFVDGSAAGYESGYLSCSHEIVPTYGEACTTSPGDVGAVQLDRL